MSTLEIHSSLGGILDRIPRKHCLATFDGHTVSDSDSLVVTSPSFKQLKPHRRKSASPQRLVRSYNSMSERSTPVSPGSGREPLGSPSTEQPTSKVDWQFMNISHPSDAKASRARRAVRSHVTRQQHQKEHLARRSKSLPQSSNSKEESVMDRGKAASISNPSSQLSESSRHQRSSITPEIPSAGTSRTTTPQPQPQTQPPGIDLLPPAWRPYVQEILDTSK